MTLNVSSLRLELTKQGRPFFSILSVGSRQTPIPPVIMNTAYWSKCIPILTHGMEIMPIGGTSICAMEQAHGEMAKMTQGLPSQTANVSCLATLGWKSLSTYIDILRLLFLWRLLLLPMSCIYKQVVIMRLYHHLYCPERSHTGPIYQILKVFRRYGLIDVLDNVLTTGIVLPLNNFKSLVKYKAKEMETDKFRVTCMLYKTLKLFKNCIQDIEMWPWWEFSSTFPVYGHKVRVMCRLLMDRHCLSEVTCHYHKSSPNCKLCTDNVVESLSHMLFKCEALHCHRNKLWREVLESAPVALQQELCNMSDNERTVFIFSGLKCHFVIEWMDLYIKLLHFCTNMYSARLNLEK